MIFLSDGQLDNMEVATEVVSSQKAYRLVVSICSYPKVAGVCDGDEDIWIEGGAVCE